MAADTALPGGGFEIPKRLNYGCFFNKVSNGEISFVEHR